MEKEPKVVKNDMKALPASSAASRASRLASVASRPTGSTAGRTRSSTWSESAAPEVAPPRLEISTRLTRPGASTIAWAVRSGASSPDSAVPPPS